MDASSALRPLWAALVGAAVVTLAAGFAWVRTGPGPGVEPELASFMGDLQHHTHKLNLSIEAENAELAEFYLHEVGEIAEQIEALFPEHDGIPVAALAGELLAPRVIALRGTLARADWEEARRGMGTLVEACNACHAAAGHAFIQVQVTTDNPFNQSFAK